MGVEALYYDQNTLDYVNAITYGKRRTPLSNICDGAIAERADGHTYIYLLPFIDESSLGLDESQIISRVPSRSPQPAMPPAGNSADGPASPSAGSSSSPAPGSSAVYSAGSSASPSAEPSTGSAAGQSIALYSIGEILSRLPEPALPLPIITPGISDNHFFRERGIPTLGFFPLSERTVVSGMHGANEHIDLEDLKSAFDILLETVLKFAL
jgi:hypothetical protein